jgi:hypothetical protein
VNEVISMTAEDLLEELRNMESKYAFQCADCAEVFDTVLEWGLHALDRHRGVWPGIEPIRRQ